VFLVNAFSLTPFPAQTEVGARQQFFANVEAELIWSVNSIDGGNSTYGTISTSGLYAAPATVPTPSTFRICARYTSDASVLACANMTVTPAVVQTPTISAISPADGMQGQQNESVSLTGQFTHWVQGATTASFGAGITVATLTINSATTATAVLNIDAARGHRNAQCDRHDGCRSRHLEQWFHGDGGHAGA
jgi:hypothetical protein